MDHLNKPVKYDIKDSNIALLGSELEHRVREHAGDKESAWLQAGFAPGLEIWRIEKFAVISGQRNVTVLSTMETHTSSCMYVTYKKNPQTETLSYDLHFWLGEDTTQDEAGTAAYKTVELDDHLHGSPVQYREVQGSESQRFLSYFLRFISLRGGVSTGFHHITSPPVDKHKLYRISISRSGGKVNLLVREVSADGASLVEGDVFVLDKGNKVLQFNTKSSAGNEKFKAAEFSQSLVNERNGHPHVDVYDEGGPGSGAFLSELGADVLPRPPETHKSLPPILLRLSDASGSVTFEPISPPTQSSLSPTEAYLMDNSSDPAQPAIYVWIGKDASLTERRLAVQYGQKYLHDKQKQGDHVHSAVSLVKMNQGNESDAFLQIIKG